MTTTITMTKRIGTQLLSPALLLAFALAQPLHAMAFAPAPRPLLPPGHQPLCRRHSRHERASLAGRYQRLRQGDRRQREARRRCPLLEGLLAQQAPASLRLAAAICDTLRAQYRRQLMEQGLRCASRINNRTYADRPHDKLAMPSMFTSIRFHIVIPASSRLQEQSRHQDPCPQLAAQPGPGQGDSHAARYPQRQSARSA